MIQVLRNLVDYMHMRENIEYNRALIDIVYSVYFFSLCFVYLVQKIFFDLKIQ